MMDDNIASAIVGESSAMCRVRTLIRKAAPTLEPVLIEGPTGTGKELVAHALHTASGRRGNLVAFNVCAIPESMFEASMFGHVRGAFTGATADVPGYLVEAEGGTAFFDELGGLPLGMQAKLLRVLETQMVRPVGAKSDRRVDFRIVAATNSRLRDLVQGGAFRADLAHRFGVIVIELPPLAARPEDIPLLLRWFGSDSYGRSRHTTFYRALQFAPDAIVALQQHSWPGNVRELEHLVNRIRILSDEDLVTAEVVYPLLEEGSTSRIPAAKVDFQRTQLLELLRRCTWRIDEVARELGVDRTTVYRRMRRLGIRTHASQFLPACDRSA